MSKTVFRKKDLVFDRFMYNKTNKTLKERLDGHPWGVDAGYLYICKEYTQCKNTRKYTPATDNYAKIGVNCSSKGPWERLRVLQQGNPRHLKFNHLYIGRPEHIKLLEEMVLYATSYERDDGEWIETDVDSLKELIDELIEHFGLYVWEYTHDPKRLPYSARNKGSCYLNAPEIELQYQITHLKEKLLEEENTNSISEIEE